MILIYRWLKDEGTRLNMRYNRVCEFVCERAHKLLVCTVHCALCTVHCAVYAHTVMHGCMRSNAYTIIYIFFTYVSHMTMTQFRYRKLCRYSETVHLPQKRSTSFQHCPIELTIQLGHTFNSDDKTHKIAVGSKDKWIGMNCTENTRKRANLQFGPPEWTFGLALATWHFIIRQKFEYGAGFFAPPLIADLGGGEWGALAGSVSHLANCPGGGGPGEGEGGREARSSSPTGNSR